MTKLKNSLQGLNSILVQAEESVNSKTVYLKLPNQRKKKEKNEKE